MEDIVIRALGVKRYYGRGESTTKALDGIDLDVRRANPHCPAGCRSIGCICAAPAVLWSGSLG